jgi:predicted CXXCH cytochrome family protein
MKSFLISSAIVLSLLGGSLRAAEESAKIMRPTDGAAMPTDQVDIVATAPAGKLELDGKPVSAEQPFPNVLHSKVKASPGAHALALIWEGGRKEIHFFVGANPPAEFHLFRQHPPLAGVECTQCHELSRRGHFRFKDESCFACHQQQGFAKVHTHEPSVLAECGMCHNAHGATTKAFLMQSKEASCKLCHN